MEKKFSIRAAMPELSEITSLIIKRAEERRLQKLDEKTLEETTDEAVKKVEDLLKDK